MKLVLEIFKVKSDELRLYGILQELSDGSDVHTAEYINTRAAD